jgi:hypothetical protein
MGFGGTCKYFTRSKPTLGPKLTTIVLLLIVNNVCTGLQTLFLTSCICEHLAGYSCPFTCLLLFHIFLNTKPLIFLGNVCVLEPKNKACVCGVNYRRNVKIVVCNLNARKSAVWGGTRCVLATISVSFLNLSFALIETLKHISS